MRSVKKKIIIIGVLILIIGAALFAYWTISPLFINKQVTESFPVPTPNSKITTLASGEFAGLEGHHASGTARLIEINGRHYVRFEENFKVTNGPDLFVYLGKKGQYDPDAKLGTLKGNIGSQNYEIPATTDLVKYNSVWVWCRAYRVAFGAANFK